MITTRIVFSDVIDGLPPNEDEGTFIGFDAEHNPYILRWNLVDKCWYMYGMYGTNIGRNVTKAIVRHARIMLVASPETSLESSLDTSRSSIGFKEDIA